jgi:DNA-binding FadR family transcriptional regulator
VKKPDNIHSRLVNELGSKIASGAIGQDGLLPREDDLVAHFAISRTIVREATKTLQALGIVITRPRIGSRIQPIMKWRLLDPQVMDWLTDSELTPRFVRDLLDLRVMIEPAAAALAAERASDEQRVALSMALEGMAAANTTARHIQADFAFHDAIMEASGNALLLQLKPVLTALLKGSFRLSMHDRGRVRASVDIHKLVAEAILRGDAEGARKATNALLDSARADIERYQKNTANKKMPRISG